MVSRFAMMLDEGPGGFGKRRRDLAVHLTCTACGGHHAVPLGARPSSGYPFRTAERSGDTPGEPDLTAPPTHECRDCGHLWTEAAPGTS